MPALFSSPQYTARLRTGDWPSLLIYREGIPLLQLPLTSGLPPFGEEVEPISRARVEKIEPFADGSMILEAAAESAAWSARRFHWRLTPDHITFQQHAEGRGRLGKCFFFSNGVPGNWSVPEIPGPEQHVTVHARQVFVPRVNHGNAYYFSPSMPQSLGIRNEMPMAFYYAQSLAGAFLPEQMANLFAPPPQVLSFGQEHTWAAVGLGEIPGLYLFNALDYSGSKYGGASLHVNYNGYRTLDGAFDSPVISIHFGYSEFEPMEKYIAWCDRSGYSTQHTTPNAAWHRRPIFCGWAEQTAQSRLTGAAPSALCTQANYEHWIAALEQRGIPFGTVLLDDKWQAGYGSFDVDLQKWPDLPGFIARQHAWGRRVLLWVPGHHTDGIDEAWHVKVDGMPAGADVTNPEYEAFLRGQIRKLVLEAGADGFKVDWTGGITAEPGVEMYASLHGKSPLYGLEFLRRFHWILYDETHRCKPDALVETHSPHPLFRESSDVLRLNDIYYGTRGVTDMMRLRARLAHIAGWPLVDCDNASSTTLAEWWEYMQAQPSIGIPALYFVTHTESTLEVPTEDQWSALAALWRKYVEEVGLQA